MSYHKDIIEEIQDEMKINMSQIKRWIDDLSDRIRLIEEKQGGVK